mmetsp:Transcript_21907/g.61224  ORF Transcript_21907/g.61224 Transcript_21907/m.61224 type:complete len:235 (+) Transcript_21907:74-778(+)
MRYGWPTTPSTAFLVGWMERLAQISGDTRKALVREAQANGWNFEDFAHLVVKTPEILNSAVGTMSGFEIAVVQRALHADFDQNTRFALETRLPFADDEAEHDGMYMREGRGGIAMPVGGPSWKVLADPRDLADGVYQHKHDPRRERCRSPFAASTNAASGRGAWPMLRTSGEIMPPPGSVVLFGDSTRATARPTSAPASGKAQKYRPCRPTAAGCADATRGFRGLATTRPAWRI